MRYQLTADDFDDVRVAACSAEPFAKPDHKAKKHSRPRQIGSGRCAFRRSHREVIDAFNEAFGASGEALNARERT
ncbi:hypothetical protein [Sinorhizobium sp. BJ1]|uniref:hypothetical protein n=1 Tax=Sinorhizobium sp. BJ1 TaxID=2035455 RepID=UPI000BE965F4|nr:hypothetical protein [Sinorhizobium sp. BJ1]PDT86530.1 hypothetical protein CO676_02245 [Sinorhizobium sp. BJ1]